MNSNQIRTQLRMQTLINKNKRGEYVSMRDLESVLGKDGIEQFCQLWEFEMSMRPQHKDASFEFRHYIDLLHKADFARTKRRYSDETSLCECAIEELEELLRDDLSLRDWLDRPAVFEGADDIGPDVEQMPRLTTSKSRWNKNPRRRK